jgi:hypothetical protein
MEDANMLFPFQITGLLFLSGALALGGPARKQLVIPPPTLTSPVNGAVMDNGCQDKSNGITWDFDWSDVPGAIEYQIRVWKNPALPVINNASTPTSDYHDDSPQSYIINSNRMGWRWMVRAKVRGRWTAWSRVGFFSVERLNTDCPKP